MKTDEMRWAYGGGVFQFNDIWREDGTRPSGQLCSKKEKGDSARLDDLSTQMDLFCILK